MSKHNHTLKLRKGGLKWQVDGELGFFQGNFPCLVLTQTLQNVASGVWIERVGILYKVPQNRAAAGP